MRSNQCRQPKLKRALVLGLFVVLCSALVYALTPAGVVIRNQATATYLDSSSETQSTSSNQVSTTVQEVLGLTLVANQTKYAVEDSTVYFPHFLTNAGNATESYVVCLSQTGLSDQFNSTLTLFLDADEDGLPDTPGTPLTTTADRKQDGDASDDLQDDGCYLIDPLDGGGAVQIVVAAVIADESPNLDVLDESLFQITGYSQTGFVDGDPYTGATATTNTDTIVITDTPIVEVLKSLDFDQGLSPSGPYTVTLTYRNTGSTDAQDLRIEEVLPTTTFTGDPGGMLYVAGSALWSHEGATAVSLTDADETDSQSDGSNSILFCAYDATCDDATSPPLDFYDDRLVAIIDSVPAGEEGTITFQINIDSGIAEAEALVNVVKFVYYDTIGPALVEDVGSAEPLDDDFLSNSVTFVVIADSANPDVVANDTDTVADTDDITEGADDGLDTNNIVYEDRTYDDVDPGTSTVEQGGFGLFYNYIWNSGDGTDTFDIVVDDVFQRDGTTLLSTPFPSGTIFQLLKPDGVNSLTDTESDGIPDTGPLDAGESYLVILKVTPPAALAGTNSGFGWDVNIVATSTEDDSLSNAVTDHLSEITQSEIDLTNAEVRDAGCAVSSPAASCNGEGDGPYAAPANTYAAETGTRISIPLWAHNIGGASDAFNLSYSDTNSPFTEGSIPAGISVQFFSVTLGMTTCDSENLGSTITNTGTVSAANKLLACAIIEVDEDYVADGVPVDIYFQALSPTTAEADIKFDRLTITQSPGLDFIPEHGGQVSAGQFIVYPHLITNTGNTNLECLNIVSTDTLVADAWSNLIYLDVDEDSTLNLGVDTLLTDQTLAPGETFSILVKVFSPASASDGTTNVTNLPLTGYIDNNDGNSAICSTAPADQIVFSLDDTTSVTDSNLTVVKSQALDALCDGVADAAFVTTRFSVDPGQCVIYELLSTNIGTDTLFDLLVKDLTPTYTEYDTSGQSCSVISGGSGTLGSGTPGVCTYVNPLADGDTGEVQVSVDYLEAGGAITVYFSVKVD